MVLVSWHVPFVPLEIWPYCWPSGFAPEISGPLVAFLFKVDFF